MAERIPAFLANWRQNIIYIGFVVIFTKMILYYLHERIWYKWIKFGLKKDKV